MGNAGYPSLALEMLIAMRVHEVTPEHIAALRAEGYDDVPEETLIALRVHEVTIDFIRRARRGGHVPDLEELIERRIHGKR